jgi:outer membrane murein-binding lipoprotein Lpp
LAIAAAVALLVSGCSELGVPAVHDMPAPRSDTTLTPDQVRAATDDLITERDHLSTEAQQTTGQINAANPQQKPSAQPAVLQQPLPAQPPPPAAQPATAYARP